MASGQLQGCRAAAGIDDSRNNDSFFDTRLVSYITPEVVAAADQLGGLLGQVRMP